MRKIWFTLLIPNKKIKKFRELLKSCDVTIKADCEDWNINTQHRFECVCLDTDYRAITDKIKDLSEEVFRDKFAVTYYIYGTYSE